MVERGDWRPVADMGWEDMKAERCGARGQIIMLLFQRSDTSCRQPVCVKIQYYNVKPLDDTVLALSPSLPPPPSPPPPAALPPPSSRRCERANSNERTNPRVSKICNCAVASYIKMLATHLPAYKRVEQKPRLSLNYYRSL